MLSTVRKRVDNMKLKKFSKSNKKRNIIVIGVFLIIGLILVGISYAVYQKEDEVKFINARVGEFETSSSDIELAMTLDGEDISIPPNKNDGYYNVAIECDHADGSWDSNRWGANIDNITSNRVKCNVSFETLETRPLSVVELGDYISMTPTSISYTIPSSLTGYSSNQTINPSELNLWRVIKKNEDGTVEVVSEYVSSVGVYFRGQTGYLNFVGSLNTIAAQYTNEKYVLKTRHMGYSNQVEKCSSVSSCPSDSVWEIDKNLVMDSIGDLVTTNTIGEKAEYFLSHRSNYIYDKGTEYYGMKTCLSTCSYLLYANGLDYTMQASLRPILTLKSDIEITSGDGKLIDTSYQLA